MWILIGAIAGGVFTLLVLNGIGRRVIARDAFIRKLISEKEKRIEELRARVHNLFELIEPYRKQMIDGTNQFRQSIDDEDETGIHQGHIKASIAVEQIEGYMAETEKLLAEMDKESEELEELEKCLLKK